MMKKYIIILLIFVITIGGCLIIKSHNSSKILDESKNENIGSDSQKYFINTYEEALKIVKGSYNNEDYTYNLIDDTETIIKIKVSIGEHEYCECEVNKKTAGMTTKCVASMNNSSQG